MLHLFDPVTQPEPNRYMTPEIRHYVLRVTRGARAGMVKTYGYSQRTAARRFADRLDREYGAICCSVSPVFA